MTWTSLKLVPCVHLRLVSLTCVPSVSTPNIWWQTVDRGAPGRGKSAEIRPCELMTLWVYDEKFPTCMRFLFAMLPFTMKKTTILSTRLKNKKSGTWWPSASSSLKELEASRTQRPSFSNQLRQIRLTVHHDHRSRLHQRLSDHLS
jgi:hypothetical protein